MFQSQLFRSRWTALGWLIFISVLFFLPGSALPKETWFSKIYIDKWVHTGFFVVLLFLCRSTIQSFAKRYTILLLLAAVTYGLMVEFVQKWWIPNRDFDYYDLLFDTIGSVLGLIAWHWVYKKNKPL